ncbi:MAG: carbohydrate-binding family 9-like protein [Myxococcaceae bacterium]|nr:carbohydrate-binding family 9-like protein [Myxococcaceae bacterium]MCI0672739.1 carbohydrate-binding family 9-like protein [Myxococcaceae bacterium]
MAPRSRISRVLPPASTPPRSPWERDRARGSVRTRALLPCLALILLAVGCRDEQAGPSSRRARPARPTAGVRTLEEPPRELTFRSGATWGGGAITYLGARVSPTVARPGQQVTVSHYFRANRSPPRGFHFFAHVLDAASGQMLFNADHEPQSGAAPLELWPVGAVVEDTHSFALPAAPGGAARVAVGFWNDAGRLPVDEASAHDGAHRMLGPSVGGPAAELLEYRVARAHKAPMLDGVLAPEEWAAATPVQLKGSFDGREPALRTTARLLYDAEHLYVAFDVEDPDVWGTLKQRDDPIYNEEVVELFLDANADGRTYNELQVSPHNVLFDAYFPARRQGMDTGWDSGMRTAVKVRGTLDAPDDRDEGWTVELAVPLARLAEVPRLPPQPGDRWRFNLYRLEHVDRARVEGQAFSPLFVGDFHALPRFGWLRFE